MCGEILNSSCLDYIKFPFYVILRNFGVNFFLYILLPKKICLVYNDSSHVYLCFSYVVLLLFASFSLVLQKVGLTIHWS